jgi:Ca-activated chloride channel family protein
MTRASRSFSAVAGLAVVAMLAACGTLGSGPGSIDVEVQLDATFAAMDDVPVGGGELRLVAPRPAQDEAGAQVRAIAFPLRHTDVRADVAGMAASYTVTQTFENPYDEPIDAVYVFPLGDGAAITSYAIVVGDRTITGEIARASEARATYRAARASGHTAALLEQAKRNVFQQRIANLAPHEAIQVRIQYLELLDYRDGQYELAFPLVVGPRYLPARDVGASPVGAHAAGEPERPGVTSIPYAPAELAGSTVSFTAEVDAGVPIGAVSSPSHPLQVAEAGPTRRRITLAGAALPNRDLIVRYRTAADRTMIGLLAHRTDARGYFTLVVQPKLEYQAGDIAPREVMIAIDTSGSMQGQPLAQAQAVATTLIDSLRPGDTFNVLAFSGGSQALAPVPLAGDPIGKAAGQRFVAALSSGGGTEMAGAIADALSEPPDGGRVRLVYFLTDGFVGNDDVVVAAARGHLGTNRIFSVGIGSAPNRALLNELAAVGRGFASYLNLAEPAQALGDELVRRTAFPYLTDVRIEWNGLAVGAVTPATIPDVYAGAPLIVSGVYTQPGRAKIALTATTAGRRIRIPLDVALPARVEDAPVAALWARKRIDELHLLAQASSPETIAQITELGLAFHLVTEHTSFVAVDRTRVVARGGSTKEIKQPALMPVGVNQASALPAPAARESSGETSHHYHHSSGLFGGGGGGGGGDVDPLTLLLALALVPLAWTLRRIRA